MEKITLITPTEEHKEKVMDYKKEFEFNGDSMDGTAGLSKVKSYDEWLAGLSNNSNRAGLVEASSFIAVRENDQKIVGMINIRHRLNEYLFQYGGHIGYSVRKSERRKGYAKEMLRQALEKCKEMNIERVLVTCNINNLASAKTIIANGGVLENEVPEADRIMQRYWIAL